MRGVAAEIAARWSVMGKGGGGWYGDVARRLDPALYPPWEGRAEGWKAASRARSCDPQLLFQVPPPSPPLPSPSASSSLSCAQGDCQCRTTS